MFNGAAAGGGGRRNPLLKDPATAVFFIKTRVPNPPNTNNLPNAIQYPWLWKRPEEDKQIALITALQELFIFGGEAVGAARPGVYTWIIKHFGEPITPEAYLSLSEAEKGRIDANSVLVAAQPICQQEYGTLHGNLDNLTLDGSVLAAGEFRKSPEGLIYNFMSGTYMKDLFSMAITPEQTATLTAALTATAAKFFPAGAKYENIAIIEGAGPISQCLVMRKLLMNLGAVRSVVPPPKPAKTKKTRSALGQGGGKRRARRSRRRL